MRSFPSDLSAKVKQSLQTLANNSQPKLKIAISRAKTTIMDSDYWTVETIREGEGLGNISVAPRRWSKNYGAPDRLYEIHVANGQISTALREYPDKLKQGWRPQFTLGPSNNPGSVAIAFDGYWKRYRGNWRLITTEKPWISWVDNAGILWTQLWDNESSRVQLASDVKFVRMLRGWKNSIIQQNDQGIVTAYIKNDGTVYYRSYCQQLDYSYAWESETALAEFTTTAVSLNLFITNDYRMGFVVEDGVGNIHWLITNRNWGGMASPSDRLTTAITNITFEVIPVSYYNTIEDEHLTGIIDVFFNVMHGASNNAFIQVENTSMEILNEANELVPDWGFKIRAILQHGLTNINSLDFTLRDSFNILYNVLSVILIEEKTYEFTMANFNNANGLSVLSFNGGTTKGEAGQMLDPFNLSFMPQGLVSTFIPLPEVIAVWNE